MTAREDHKLILVNNGTIKRRGMDNDSLTQPCNECTTEKRQENQEYGVVISSSVSTVDLQMIWLEGNVLEEAEGGWMEKEEESKNERKERNG